MEREVFKSMAFGEDAAEHLEKVLELAERGELESIAYRVFLTDGTIKDYVVGGTKEDREILKAQMESMLAERGGSLN